MTNTQFFTDSTADLPYDYIKEHNIRVIGLTYVIDGAEYMCTNTPDDPDCLSPQAFYARMRKGSTPTTALINNQRFIDHFEPVLKEGRDVFYVAFSSGLSASCQNAMVVGAELMEKYPGRRVHVVDTLNASLGEGMAMTLAIQKHEEGLSDEEVVAYFNQAQTKVHSWFTVDDLVYLKRGGRVSSASAIIGSVLNIKPVLYVNAEGKLIPHDKVQGRKRELKALVDQMEATMAGGLTGDSVFIGHGDCEEDAQLVAKMIKQRFGIDVGIVNYITPIIGAHSGPGTVAVFYMGKEDRIA